MYTSRKVALLACIALFAVSAGWATPFYLPSLPNFYQHQKAFQGQYPPQDGAGNWTAPPGALPDPPDPLQLAPSYNSTKNWWERGGGWCCTTAVSDMLYSIQTTYFSNDPNLFYGELGHTWLEYMNYGIEKFYFDYFKTADNFATILDNRGFGEDKIHYQEYFVDTTGALLKSAPTDFCGVCATPGGTPSGYSNMHDLYNATLSQSQYIALDIVSTGVTDTTARGIWWNYHVIAGAGYDPDKNLIFIADPNRNLTGANKGAGNNAGIGWGHPYTSTDAFPGTAADFVTYRLNGNKLEAVDPNNTAYDGLLVTRAMVLSPIPEPGYGLLVMVLSIVVIQRVRRG